MSAIPQPFITESVKRYTLGVLVVVYTFNFIDRQILSILIEPIKADLGVSAHLRSSTPLWACRWR
jgi:hypothetical protein